MNNENAMTTNKVILTGEIVPEPQFSHEIYGEGFYELFLRVKRLSESYDTLPVTVSERLIAEHSLKVGAVVTVAGQFRSYNKIVDEKSRLMLTVFAREIHETPEGENPNYIELSGFICKPPVYRTTPFNREICDVLLAVNRAYNKSDYIPCITWGRNARFVKYLGVGEKVVIYGRIQSREYQKKIDETEIVTKTAYEVSVSKILVGQNAETEGAFLSDYGYSYPQS